MKDALEYKGYFGSAHYSREDEIFYGKVKHIRSLISYEGRDVRSLNHGFREAVDDYLELCKQQGQEPEKPFRGTFNVRTGTELHRRAAIFASKTGKTLNQVVAEALEDYLRAS